jgi:hypothetical protein
MHSTQNLFIFCAKMNKNQITICQGSKKWGYNMKVIRRSNIYSKYIYTTRKINALNNYKIHDYEILRKK